MVGRIGISLAAGVIMTFALLWVMQILIATGKDALGDGKDYKFVDFVRVNREETIE